MKIGKTETEKIADEILVCRNIVKEILNFGVTESQKIDIIYFLSLELENRESLEKITDVVKKIRRTINQDEESGYNEEDNKNKLIGV
ncbi:MAG: hypothetical protein ACW98D_18660 [Promethearchaeota archaeon]